MVFSEEDIFFKQRTKRYNLPRVPRTTAIPFYSCPYLLTRKTLQGLNETGSHLNICSVRGAQPSSEISTGQKSIL